MIYQKFEETLKKNKLPQKPREPHKEYQVSDYNSEEEYHIAMAETHYPKYREDMKEYEKNKTDFYQTQNKVFEDFKKALFEEYGPNDANEKQLEMIYSKAYEEGHSSGMYQIENEFESLSDFIMEYQKIS